MLPHESSAPAPDARVLMRPLKPALWRPLGLAHRVGGDDGATQQVLRVLQALGGVRAAPLNPTAAARG